MRKENDNIKMEVSANPGKSRRRPYFIKTPWWLKAMFPKRIWHIGRGEKVIYLTFDDGPHPVATPFVLDLLKEYKAKATFFCIGKNVDDFPAIYKRILDEGHAVGNHTQHHLNGWKTANDIYIKDVKEAAKRIQSGLFRPPYGRIRSSQVRKLAGFRIIMWDVLSGDFDKAVSPESCYQYVMNHTNNGSIVVFHDSEKAWSKMSNTLPLVLEHFSKKGFQFSAILSGENDGLH